jgi:hypothetical protein
VHPNYSGVLLVVRQELGKRGQSRGCQLDSGTMELICYGLFIHLTDSLLNNHLLRPLLTSCSTEYTCIRTRNTVLETTVYHAKSGAPCHVTCFSRDAWRAMSKGSASITVHYMISSSSFGGCVACYGCSSEMTLMKYRLET